MSSILALDAGNAWIKAVTDSGAEIRFPHALRELSTAKVDEIEMRGGTDDPNIYKVNKTYYAIGEQALRDGDGSVKYGESRYQRDYYGVLGAIAAFRAFPASARDVTVYGSHTPKDLVYRPDLIEAIKGIWNVEGQGVKKTFRLIEAHGADEPVMAYRHAILSDDGMSYRGDVALRRGDCLIIDIGGFTTALTVAVSGKIDYSSARSFDGGIIDVRDNLAKGIKRRYRTQIKGLNFFRPDKLDSALQTGKYQAGMEGELDCLKEVNDVCNPLLSSIINYINNYGGLGSFESILLAGGGGVLMEKRMRDSLKKASVFMPDQDRARVQLATALGMLKTMRALEAKGKKLA